MIVTQEEAKTKWCPHALTHDGDQITGVNRKYDGGADIGSHCIASDCMMWRWLQLPMRQISQKPVEGWEHIPADDSEEYAEHWLEPWESAQSKRPGYCALAGKPENLNA